MPGDRHIAIAISVALALAGAACAPPAEPDDGDGTDPIGGGTGYVGTPPVGAVIPFDASGVWTWVPFADAKCGDGSSTGLGIRKGTSNDLVVFLDGGGACWSYETCVLKTAFDRSFGEAQFATERDDFFPGSLLDPQALPSTWRAANLVFVPYCTGDVHGGDRVATYSLPMGYDPKTWNHRGHANVMAFLKRLKATFPSVSRLLVAGSSAGGFGAVVNYEAFRWYWPQAAGYLVDDSGPTLVQGDISAGMRDTWYAAWNLDASLGRFCAGCRSDMSAGIAAIAANHPADRIAFLSHVDDPVMTSFLGSLDFHADVDRLEATRFRAANTRVFYEYGTFPNYAHMLLTPLTVWDGSGTYVASHGTLGTSLDVWLQRMLEDDTAWATVKP